MKHMASLLRYYYFSSPVVETGTWPLIWPLVFLRLDVLAGG
jgi:hypothetical protein